MGNWQTREVGRAKRLMPRAAPWVWVGDGQSWLLGSRLTPGVSAPARSARPHCWFYQVPPAARDQAHLSGVLRKAQLLCRSHKPHRSWLIWGNWEEAEMKLQLSSFIPTRTILLERSVAPGARAPAPAYASGGDITDVFED